MHINEINDTDALQAIISRAMQQGNIQGHLSEPLEFRIICALHRIDVLEGVEKAKKVARECSVPTRLVQVKTSQEVEDQLDAIFSK